VLTTEIDVSFFKMSLWHPIPFNSQYEASDIGQIRNKKTSKILKPWLHKHGKNRQVYNYKPRYQVTLMENGKRKKYLVHRLVAFAFNIISDNSDVDHINGIPTDNRVINLRAASRSQNMKNQVARKQNNIKQTKSSRYIGVSKSFGKWEYRVNHNGHTIARGRCDTEEEAARQYNIHKLNIDNDFSTMNVVNNPGTIIRSVEVPHN
jgi:hypothetical protein